MIFKMENIIIKEENNLEQLSLGELLKKNRESLDIKIQEVSSFLKVRSSEIKLLENNDIEKIAKSIYIPGLIKSYGKYLNMP
jgi:cytoskeletal protein RodZ